MQHDKKIGRNNESERDREREEVVQNVRTRYTCNSLRKLLSRNAQELPIATDNSEIDDQNFSRENTIEYFGTWGKQGRRNVAENEMVDR